MMMNPQLLFLLGLMALGTVHASPSAELKLERGSCPMFWFSFNGRCYKYIGAPTLLTWHDAEKNCQDEGGNLVSIHNQEENGFVEALIENYKPSSKSSWIGLNELYVEGRWKWTDGSNGSYTKWRVGQPDDSGPCVFTYLGSWLALPCAYYSPGNANFLASVCVRHP